MSYQSKPLSKLSAAALAGALLTGLAGFSGASSAEEAGQASGQTQTNASFERFKNRVENIVKDHEEKTEEKRAAVGAKRAPMLIAM